MNLRWRFPALTTSVNNNSIFLPSQFSHVLVSNKMYKGMLQEICHQRRWAPPTYSTMKDGPDHLPRFKSSVSVNGLTFDSTESCGTSREAHNDAAKHAFLHLAVPLPEYSGQIEGVHNDRRSKAIVAIGGCTFENKEQLRTLKETEQAAAESALISLSQEGFQVGDPVLYKNLLQEFAQRERIDMPAYKTQKSGPPHTPAFFSSVGVGGEVFHGKSGGSKKEAERQAAKVAYCVLEERKSGSTPLSAESDFGKTYGIQAGSSSKNFLLSPSGNLLPCTLTVPGISSRSISETSHGIMSPNTNIIPENGSPFPAVREVEKCDGIQAAFPSESIPISPNGDPDISTLAISGSNVSKTPYLLNDRVRVYPYYQDTAFPEGITVLPIGEDKWVVVSLEFPNEDRCCLSDAATWLTFHESL